MSYIKVVAGVIIKENKILIARRKKGKSLEFMWEYPGGKVEENESEKECLKRELLEEFSIETEIKQFLTESFHDYGSFKINLRAYLVTHISGDFQLTDHDQVEWITKEEFLNYDFAPADLPINEYLIENNV